MRMQKQSSIDRLDRKKRHARRVMVLAMIALLSYYSALDWVQAADGDLDKSFGKDGIVLTLFDTPLGPNGAFNEGRTVAIQADGKIVAAGEADHNDIGMDGVLGRYNRDGSLDATFGSAGKVITPAISGLDAISIQSDGKIVAASRYGLLRVGVDGSLDTGFGIGGKVASFDTRSLALQTDGKIVTGAVISPDNGASFLFAIRRFNSDGSPDVTFGSGGAATVDVPGHFAIVAKVALQPDGKIIAGGSAVPGPGKSPGFLAIARLNSDGSIDAGFGSAGLVTAPFNIAVRDIAVRDDGKIVAAGSDFQASGYFFAAARYNPDGSPDPTFGKGGLLSAPFFPGVVTRPSPPPRLTTAAIRRDGKFIAAGQAGSGLAIARYNADGSLDTSFGAGGSVVTHITDPRSGDADVILGIAWQADGQIVVTGSANDNDKNELVVARYNTEPDFALEFSQPTESVSPGAKAKVTLNIARLGGYTGKVTITPPNASALDIRITPDSVTTTDDFVRVKVKVRGDTPLGSHPLVFAAHSDTGQAHSATLTVVVQ